MSLTRGAAGPRHAQSQIARAAHVAARRDQMASYLRRQAEVRFHLHEPGKGTSVRTRTLPLWRRQLCWQLLAAGVVLAYVASLAWVHRPASGYNSLWDGWIGNLATAIPVIAMLLRAWSTPRFRGAWLAIAVGVSLYDGGNLVYLFHDQNLHPIPDPAISDAFYLSEYVALAIGVVLLTQRSFGAVRISTRLDGAISGLAVAAGAGLLWFNSVLRIAGNPLAAAVGMAYPLMDLVLLVLLVSGFAPMRYRPTRPILLLMLGVAAFVVGDVVYLNQQVAGTYVQGTLLDGTWAVGIWMMGLAAWPNERRRSRRAALAASSDVPNGITFVPIVFGVASVLVLVVSLFHRTSVVTSLLALGALALVIVRMAITLHEVVDVERLSSRTARLDELTGLGNRRAFFELGQHRLDGRDPDGRLGIVLVDLDGFKEINDSLGHACGDELLRVIARRFERVSATRGTTSRIGGDEFACTFEVASTDELVAIGTELAAILADPISVDGTAVRVSASFGIASCPDHGTTLNELLRCADVAMYKAKMSHTLVRLYHPEDDVHTRDELVLIDDLRTSSWERDLVLNFQPTVDLITGRVCGIEALVRWRHKNFGLLYPDDFIPLAERTGLIHALTRAVLEGAIEQQASLRSGGHDLTMSVNISRFDLLDDELPTFIAGLLSRHGVPPARLTLEITETSLGAEPEHARRSIEHLRELGVRISIDDFGVGYSSMSQLLELTVDELKIDKSFVLALRTDERARAVISATIEFARALRLTVVAEGIETSATLGVVQRLGVDVGQGYFLSVPLTTSQLADFLARPDRSLDATSLERDMAE